MATLPYPLGQLSSFGIIWSSLSGAYMMKGLYQAVAGSGADRDFDGQKGILRFNKRFGIIWTSLSGAYMMKGLYQAVAGSGADMDFDGQKGILRFNKSFGIIWTSLSGAYMMKGLYQAVAGSGADRDLDGQKGILRFSKRPVRRLFIALGLNGAMYIAVCNCYIFGNTNFGWLQWILDQAKLPAQPSTDKLSVMVGGGLLLSHTFVRLYQSIYVNVFSTHLTQGPLDWLAPNIYSLLAGVTLISEAPALDGSDLGWFDWSLISWRHIVGVGLFTFLWYNDSKLQVQLAKFRRNRAGHIVSEDHKMPKGGMFEVVSSPQLLSEIFFNCTIGLALGFGHTGWWTCVGYVAISQIVRALGRQQWYRKKYEALPKGRKAIIPYLL